MYFLNLNNCLKVVIEYKSNNSISHKMATSTYSCFTSDTNIWHISSTRICVLLEILIFKFTM